MIPVSIIGMGMAPSDLTSTHLEVIRNAEILVGGKRHLAHFNDLHVPKITVAKDLDGLMTDIRLQMMQKRVVVLASGDPLYYGIGSRVIAAFGRENVCVYPNVTAVSAAFARLGRPWQDVPVFSLHGRNAEHAFLEKLTGSDVMAVFTDVKRNPAWLASFLLKHRLNACRMFVCEQMGTEEERVEWYDLETAAALSFSEPNIVILEKSGALVADHPLHAGMPDHCFEHENGLITKAEVRAVTLAKLQLHSNHVLWDLGAGSGSVSIEASLYIRTGTIVAVEKNEVRIAQIKNNLMRFGVTNVRVIQSNLPAGLCDELPAPDRIFIGGGGRDLSKILRTAAGYLAPRGIIVVNTVILENIGVALNTLKSEGFKAETVCVQINRSKMMPWGERMAAENPVWVISGKSMHR